MNKKETLSNLRYAAAYLIQWKSHIQGFMWGLSVDSRHLPLIHTESRYSQWFFTEGQVLHSLPSFNQIEPCLENCFEQFQALHKFINSEPAKAGLFSSQHKLDEQRKQQIEALGNQVFAYLHNLIDLTKTLEKEASKLSEEEFEALI